MFTHSFFLFVLLHSNLFSHPDVLIGLSILAYRYEGLRRSDFEFVLRELHEDMSQELLPFNKRKANIQFATWVALAGGRVRGWNRQVDEEKMRKREKKEQAERLRLEAEGLESGLNIVSSLKTTDAPLIPTANRGQEFSFDARPVPDLLTMPIASANGGNGFLDQPADGASASASSSAVSQQLYSLAGNDELSRSAGGHEIWPLQLIDFGDEEQFDILYQLLYKLPHMSYHYLMNYIFNDVMRHQGLKLSASGQSLGGEMLFKKRLGFSGTPSDLLPLELGKCEYERGSDGKMLHYLSSPEIMSIELLENEWNVESLLNRIAQADPPYHALIDTGALITGRNRSKAENMSIKWIAQIICHFGTALLRSFFSFPSPSSLFRYDEFGSSDLSPSSWPSDDARCRLS